MTRAKRCGGFQTGAGANAPVSVFKYNGTEYVAEYAGGNDLAGASHGANYWLFSLNGKLSQVKAGAAAVAGTARWYRQEGRRPRPHQSTSTLVSKNDQ